MQRPALSELEGCVLGIVHVRGRCTAYEVRKELENSPSAYWSASAGAVYPLVERLVARGLLAVHETEWGSRTRRAFSLPRRGLSALRRWIGPAVPDWAAAATFDPIRTRLLFLKVLPPSERGEFLREAQDALRRAIDGMQQLLSTAKPWDDLARWGIRGGILELKTRLRWVRQVAAAQERLLRSDAAGGGR
jgi:DNA-binding PadR family transcriptional regulator